MEHEEPLTGGNVGEGVVRVGATVRKPWTAATPHVHAYMTALRGKGIDVPEVLGRDHHGRQIIEYVPGRLALHSPRLGLRELTRVGGMVRGIHDASETFRPPAAARWDTAIPAPGHDLMCHNDLAPWNLLVGDRWVFIDWDAAAPSTRLWDLAYSAQAFTLSDPAEAPEEAARRLVAFAAGYRADRAVRLRLPEALASRARAMYDLLESSHRSGREPWGTMFSEGHGKHWLAVSDYVERHRAVWAEALTKSAPP